MCFRLLSIVTLGILLSCSKSKDDFSDIGLLGHVASGLYNPNQFFPENSAEAIEYVLSFQEVSGVELDIQFSKDGELWLFHDELLDTKTNAVGRICDKSATEMQSTHYNTINKENVALLSAVDFSKANGHKTVFLDIKLGGCSFDFDVFQQLKSHFDQLQAAFIDQIEFIFIANYDDLTALFLAEGYTIFRDVTSYQGAIEMLDNYDVEGFYIRHHQLESEEIEQLQAQGKKVALFEIRSPLTIRKALKKQPDYILVEDVKSAIIEKYN
jgi:glycerophosphoryl diester phosphodiesterase